MAKVFSIKNSCDSLDINYSNLIEKMNDGLIIVDCNYNFILLNESAKKMFTSRTEDAKFYDYMDNLVDKKALLSKIFKGESFKDMVLKTCRTNNAKYYSFSGNPLYTDGKIDKGLISVRDVTERYKNRKSYGCQGDKLLIKTLSNLNLPYTIIGYPSFKIEYINSKAYDNLCKINKNINSRKDIIGKDYFILQNYLIDDQLEIKRQLDYIVKNDHNLYLHKKSQFIGGNLVHLRLFYQVIRNSENKAHKIVVVEIDITEDIRDKSLLKRTFEAQEEILFNISHELRTPLNVISSANQMLEFTLANMDLSAQDKDTVKRLNNIIRKNCYRFTKLINNITDLSKIDLGDLEINLENVDIVQLLRDLVGAIKEYDVHKRVNISFISNVDKKLMACDPIIVERIFLNLVANSIKFSPKKVDINVELIDKKDTVEIIVSDKGIGIDKKDLDIIFLRFHQVDKSLTRKAEGIGIGLSIVKSLVDLHEGNIRVHSQLGKGSTFIVELPATKKEEQMCINGLREMRDYNHSIKIEFSDIYPL